MDWWLFSLNLLILLVILYTARDLAGLRRDVARLDRKVNLVLKQMNIPFEAAFGLSEKETGAGLADAKEIVEGWIDSLQR